MQIKEYIESVCMHIKYKPIRKEIEGELQNHIEEQKEYYIEEGIENDIAEDMAINQMGDATEIGKKLNKIHRPKLDWKLIIILFITLAFGLLVTFTRAQAHILYLNETGVITKHISFLILAIIIDTCIYFVDYRKLQKYSIILFIIATIFIIFTINFGAKINGVPFFRIGFLCCSVSTIAMPLYLISFVGLLQNKNTNNNIKIEFSGKNINISINFIKIIACSIISLVMLAIIPSLTSVFIVAVSYFTILIIKILKDATNKKKKILCLISVSICTIISILIVYNFSPIGMFRFNRIITSFNPELDPYGSGWQGMQQNLIINSAQLFGEADDMSNALNSFDEGTNYAFISLLAHYGWIISIGMVIAIMMLDIKLIINAIKIKDTYGKMLIIAISSMFILKSVCNILMNLNLGIKADFNIPFISYGGANLIIDMMCLGLVLSVYKRKNLNLSKEVNKVY